jgi:O-antigen/teichoic acid export membrane protein|tara:strand:- start:12789 stop:13928 length:1140 start_codon:yes stop_codon:yes gene_type:complete
LEIPEKFKNITSIGVADIIGTGSTALFWFYIASLIDPEQYGEIFYILGIANIASAFALFAHENSIIVSVAKKLKIQSTLYLISLCITILASGIVMILFYKIEPGLVVIGYVINTLAIGDMIGRKHFSSYSRYVLLQKGLTVVLGISFFYAFGVDGIIFAIGIAYFGFFIKAYKGLKDSKPDFSLLKPRKEFLISNYLFGLTVILRNHLDKIIIPVILSFTVLGNFAFSLQIFAALMIFPNIIYKLIVPHDATGESTRRIKEITILISVCFAIIGIFLAPIIIPHFFPDFVDAITIIQIISIAIIPETMIIMLTSKILAVEKSKLLLIGRTIGVIARISGITLLGIYFEIYGVAIGFLLASCIECAFLGIVSIKEKKNGK